MAFTKPKRLILIHGAWAGAWVWERLELALVTLGWNVQAIDLPGDGQHPISAQSVKQRDFLAHLKRVIHDGDGPVALVGHSGGGMFVTQAADAFPEQVSHAIWIAGFLLPNGETYDEILQHVDHQATHLGAMYYAKLSDDGLTTTIPRDAARTLFFHDADETIAQSAASKLTPQPVCGARLRTPTGDAFKNLSKLYVLATEDKSILPAAQRFMCRNIPRLTVKEIASGHTPQLTQTATVAQMINSWIK